MINPKTTQTMKNQNEKLQDLVNRLIKNSTRNLQMSKSASTDHFTGLCKGYADAYGLTAIYIQEIIDYELQDNEK